MCSKSASRWATGTHPQSHGSDEAAVDRPDREAVGWAGVEDVHGTAVVERRVESHPGLAEEQPLEASRRRPGTSTGQHLQEHGLGGVQVSPEVLAHISGGRPIGPAQEVDPDGRVHERHTGSTRSALS